MFSRERIPIFFFSPSLESFFTKFPLLLDISIATIFQTKTFFNNNSHKYETKIVIYLTSLGERKRNSRGKN